MKQLATLGLAVLLSVGPAVWAEAQDPVPNNKETKDKTKGKQTLIEVLIKVTGDGAVIPDETVTATFSGRSPMSERTNHQGIASFTLSDASSGSLRVLLTLQGWETFVHDYPVAPPEARIDVQLTRRGSGAK